MKKCQSCNTINCDEAMFCKKCGAKFSNDPVATYGISVFTFIAGGDIQIYYRGRTYTIDSRILIDCLQKDISRQDLFYVIRSNLSLSHPTPQSYIEYFEDNKYLFARNFCLITYINNSDYTDFLKFKRENASLFGLYRIQQEMQVLPLMFCGEYYNSDDAIEFSFEDYFCVAELGGLVCDILDAGYNGRRHLNSFPNGKRIHSLDHDEVLCSLITSSLVYYGIVTGNLNFGGIVFLPKLSFDLKIRLPEQGRTYDVSKLGTLFPSKETMVLQGICKMILIEWGDALSHIDVIALFGYLPDEVLLTFDIKVSNEIHVTLEDTRKNKKVSLTWSDLIDRI